MNKSATTPALIFGICILLGLGILGYQLASAAITFKSLDRSVTVKGLSEREVEATIAAWPISFQVTANDLDTLFQSLESSTATIVAYLKSHGIADEAITVAAPAVNDAHANNWGDKRHIKFRYSANGAVTVYSKDIAAVRKAMANLIDLGKQGVLIGGERYRHDTDNVFMFTELSALKPAMIEEATKNARAVADKFAEDSASELGKIKSARQGQFSIRNRDATTPHIKIVRVVTTVEYYLSD